MGQLIVQPITLVKTAEALQQLGGDLAAQNQSLPVSPIELGEGQVASSLESFTMLWGNAIADVEKHVGGLVDKLNQAAANYEATERKIQRAEQM